MNTAAAAATSGLWSEQVVDMPGMGPGANKAGWWVAYLNELMMLGKYEDVLKWLSKARQTGAIFAIIKAKEEMTREYVVKKAPTKVVKPSAIKKAKVRKVVVEKAEPYFNHVHGKVA
jgi:hypothetical protein